MIRGDVSGLHRIRNPYPGRIVMIGLIGRLIVLVTAMTGRSAPSKERQYRLEIGSVRAVPLDPNTPPDPHRHYLALINDDRVLVGGNGAQTEEIIAVYRSDKSFSDAIRLMEPEDEQYRTARISVAYHPQAEVLHLGIVRNQGENPETDRLHVSYQLGEVNDRTLLVLTTYQDGNPNAPYQGEPEAIPYEGDPSMIAKWLYGQLDPETRVAVAAMTYNLDTENVEYQAYPPFTA